MVEVMRSRRREVWYQWYRWYLATVWRVSVSAPVTAFIRHMAPSQGHQY